MPNLADYLLANRSGGNFGTMSPGEEAAAVTPGSVLDALANSAYRLGATPRDAMRTGVQPTGGMLSDEDVARAQLSSGDVQDRASQLAMLMVGTPRGGGGLGSGLPRVPPGTEQPAADAYRLGRQAFSGGHPETANPHAGEDILGAEWLRGYKQQRKTDRFDATIANRRTSGGSGGTTLGSGVQLPEIGKYGQYAENYPPIAPPVTQVDKATGKEFLGKGTSPEVEAFRKDRAAIQKDIQAGNYDPYFPEAQRYDADPSKFPTFKDTSDIQMKKPETVAKYEAIARDPAALDKLSTAFDEGMKNFQDTGNWYHMGQLADQFEAHYGPDLGPRMFKQKFADAMAATTGGADPTSNLLMAHYGNYLHEHGVPTPGASYDMPFPIGGRYVTGNMAQYDKMIRQGEGVTPENPKRYNFSGAFQGNPGAMTIDEQMSSPYMMGGKPMGMPPPGTYGHFQGAMGDLAAAKGVDPRGFQDVTWAGLKGEVTGPMMRHVNQAIERTSRLTGASPAEVVREALVKSRRPLYGAAGGAGLGDVLLQSQRQEQ